MSITEHGLHPRRRAAKSPAPKGRNSSAQGNALGASPQHPSPERAAQSASRSLSPATAKLAHGLLDSALSQSDRVEFIADVVICRAAARIIDDLTITGRTKREWMEQAMVIISQEIADAGMQLVPATAQSGDICACADNADTVICGECAKPLNLAPPWISVADDLPDGEATVLVGWDASTVSPFPTEESPVWLGYWDGHDWRDMDHLRFAPQPTHWQDRPSAPAPILSK